MRVADWEPRLSEVIEGARDKPFKWGVHDCCIFAADCVLAISGKDPMEGLRGQYSDRRSALEILNEHGGPDALFDARLKRIGAQEIMPAYAQRGDVISMAQENAGARIMVAYRSFVIGPGDNGLLRKDRPSGARAWHI